MKWDAMFDSEDLLAYGYGSTPSRRGRRLTRRAVAKRQTSPARRAPSSIRPSGRWRRGFRAAWSWPTPISAAGVPAASGVRPPASKTPFVAAVSTGPEGHPRKLMLAPVRGFPKREISRGARRRLASGSEVVTDAPDHAERHLASSDWRYNRRYQLQTMIPRFFHSVARTEPMPYQIVVAG